MPSPSTVPETFREFALHQPDPAGPKLITPDGAISGVPTVTVRASINMGSTAEALFALFLPGDGTPAPAAIPPEAVRLSSNIAADVPILGTTLQVTHQTLVIWPDNGTAILRHEFDIVDVKDWHFQTPSEDAGVPEVEASLHGTIVVRVDQPSERSGGVFRAKIFPGTVDVGALGVPPTDAVMLYETSGVFENDVDVGEVTKGAARDKTLAVWTPSGAVRTLPFRVTYPAASGGQHGPVNVYPKNAIWFAWAPPDFTAPQGEDDSYTNGPGNPLWRYIHRPTRVAIPRDATSVTITAPSAAMWEYDENSNTTNAAGLPGATEDPVSLETPGHYQLQDPLRSHHIHETEDDPNGTVVTKPIGALVGIWGIHPEVDVFEILIGLNKTLTIPTAPRPHYLFLGMHKETRWQDAGDDPIPVSLQWT